MADCVPPTSVAISLTHNLFSNKTFIIFTLVESANTLNSSAISIIVSSSSNSFLPLATSLVKFIIYTIVYFGFVFGYLLLGLKVNINFLGCKLIVYYSVYYYIGYCFRIFQEKAITIYKRQENIILCILAAGYFLGGYKFKVMAVPDTTIYIIIRFLLAISGMVTFLHFSYMIYKRLSCKVIKKIGVHTLELYYVHSFLMNSLFLNRAKVLMSMNGLLNSFILSINTGNIKLIIITNIKIAIT
mgnify:CR=1 FL=1